MIPTTVERDKEIASKLSYLSDLWEKSIPDIGNRVTALQLAKLLLTLMCAGVNLRAESTGKLFATLHGTSPTGVMATEVGILDVYFKDDELHFGNMSDYKAPKYVLKNPDMVDGDMNILMIIKNYEILAAYNLSTKQRDELSDEVKNVLARVQMIETKLTNTSDFLGGRRY